MIALLDANCSKNHLRSAVARAFFERAIGLHDVPEKIAIDKSGSSKATIVSI